MSVSKQLDKIFVRDFALEMLIGIYPKEKKQKQRVLVNLEVFTDPLSGVNDKYERTVCYETLIRHIETCGAEHVNLVETLAENIAAACLKDPQIKKVMVRIEKPDVFQNARSVGVEIFRP